MSLPIEERNRFDRLLEEILESLPEDIGQLLETVPLIVEDEPDESGDDSDESDLCGLHWGIPLTERSVLDGEPGLDRIEIFRGPVLRLSGKKTGELRRQIRITLLHEIGHHFGLSEEKLEDLGYG